jgi:hypothetical protein
VLLVCTVYNVLCSEIAVLDTVRSETHLYIQFMLRMTDAMTSQNIDLSSWDTLYSSSWDTLYSSSWDTPYSSSWDTLYSSSCDTLYMRKYMPCPCTDIFFYSHLLRTLLMVYK